MKTLHPTNLKRAELRKAFRAAFNSLYPYNFPTSGDLKVTNKHYTAKGWLHQKRYLIPPLLAFIIPLIVRVIPEILMGPYVIGFDTIAFYVPNTLDWLKNGIEPFAFISSAPLIDILLMGIASAGASIVFALKLLAPLILGLLGFSVYFYASKALSWSPKKSLLVALLSTLYFVALRVSWDMLRIELALIFLFPLLILLQKNKLSIKNGLLLSLLMILVVFTNQLVAVIMFAIVIATTASLFFKKERAELPKLFALAVPSIFLFLTIFYMNYFLISLPTAGYSMDFGGGFETLIGASGPQLILDTLGFLAFCYLPLVPLLVFSARRFKSNIQLKAWIVWTFIPIILVLVSQNAFFTGGIPTFRWILLLTYPLTFYAVAGLSAIKWNWYKVSVGAILVVLSLSFLVSTNSGAISIYGTFPSYIPKTMLQNTIDLSDCQDTANALIWAKNNMPSNGHLFAHEAFYGQAILTLDVDQLIPYYYATPTQAVSQLNATNQSYPLYLIWWVNGTGWYGQPTVPSSFQELYCSGNIAIFNYTVNI